MAATLPDGSKDFYGLSFASRSGDYRLDLLVAGNSTDSDGDGLPDWWEKLFGHDPNIADAGGDLDNDGWSNLEEFHRGSNPAVSNRKPQLATTEITIPETGEAGVYLHIPFCKSRCSYCDFATDVYRTNDAVERYVAALCNEVRNACVSWRNGARV